MEENPELCSPSPTINDEDSPGGQSNHYLHVMSGIAGTPSYMTQYAEAQKEVAAQAFIAAAQAASAQLHPDLDRRAHHAYTGEELYSASLVHELSAQAHAWHPYDAYHMMPPAHVAHMYPSYVGLGVDHYGHGILDDPLDTLKSNKKKDREEDLESMVECPECNKWFKNRSSLSSHKKTHNPSAKLHICEVCSQTFSRSHGNYERFHDVDLRRHEFTHSKQRHFTCTDCNRSFSRKDALKRHVDSMGKKEGGCLQK
jgi:hypothetical protein